MIYLELFLTFLKIGVCTFGGGYAMLPMIMQEVEAHGWADNATLLDFVGLSESTPGPFAVNIATFIGENSGGFLGALCATLGVVLPSFIIILAISYFLEQFMDIKWVVGAFWGIKIAVAILIIDAALRMFKKLEKKPLTFVLAALAFAAMMAVDILSLRISSVVIMLVCAVISFIVYLAKKAGKGKGEAQ